jgi:hypothetical protein
MKQFLLVLYFIGCIAFNISAQVMFQKAIGGTNNDNGNYVKQTNEGGYIIAAGTSSYSIGYSDIYLIKSDSVGNILWKKTYGATGPDGVGALALTSDGGYLLAGSTSSFGAGGNDVLLLKTDGNGDTLWAKTYGDTANESFLSIDMTSDGGYILVGSTNSSGAGNNDVYLLKTDSVGNLMWARTYGGPLNDNGVTVLQTSNGYIISGSSEDSTGQYRVYLIKTNSNGSVTWSEILAVGLNCYGGSVLLASDGGYFIFVSFIDHIEILKINSVGNFIWGKHLYSNAPVIGRSMQPTSDGGFIITGQTECPYSNQNIYLTKTDSLVHVLWSKSIGDSLLNDAAAYVEQTSDRGYILAGYTSSFGAGNRDLYLIKTDSAGNSGCYENDCFTGVSSAGATVQFPNISIAVPSVIVTSPTFIIGSGGIETPLCLSFVSTEENIPKQNFAYVFPNPAKEQFWVRINSSFQESYLLTILDVTGRKISEAKFEMEVGERDYPVNISSLKPGLYLIKIKGEKIEQTYKIIKQD